MLQVSLDCFYQCRQQGTTLGVHLGNCCLSLALHGQRDDIQGNGTVKSFHPDDFYHQSLFITCLFPGLSNCRSEPFQHVLYLFMSLDNFQPLVLTLGRRRDQDHIARRNGPLVGRHH